MVYGHFNSANYYLKSADKVFFGGSAIFANGYLQTTCGSSSIALLAYSSRVPVYVLIKTYKFNENSELNPFSQNFSPPGDKQDDRRVQLEYDLVPSQFISLLITEIGLMPPTSVSLIVKEIQKVE